MSFVCPLHARKVTIKNTIIKRIKTKKRRRYSIKSISRQVRKLEKFNSIPVRVTSVKARKQCKYVVSEFFFFLKNEFVRYLYATHIF